MPEVDCDVQAAVSPGAAGQATKIGYCYSFTGFGLDATKLPVNSVVPTPLPVGFSPTYTPTQGQMSTDSTSSQSNIKVFGIMVNLAWTPPEANNKLRIAMYVDQVAWEQFRVLSEDVIADTSITAFEFDCFEYNASAKKWIEIFYPEVATNPLVGNLNTQGKRSSLVVAESGERIFGANVATLWYLVQFEMVPLGDKPYSITFVTNTTKKTKQWGSTIAGGTTTT